MKNTKPKYELGFNGTRAMVMRCKDFPALWEDIKTRNVEKLEFFLFTMQDCTHFVEVPSITELRLDMLKKLSSLEGISALRNSLKSLYIESCGRNITDWSPLSELSNLEELVIASHGVISDLSFLKPLAKLNNIRILETKITAEDLSPLGAIQEVVYFHTGIDKKLDAYLSESQTEFKRAVQNRVKELASQIGGGVR